MPMWIWNRNSMIAANHIIMLASRFGAGISDTTKYGDQFISPDGTEMRHTLGMNSDLKIDAFNHRQIEIFA